jgi:DnaD/phage-associated family protein
MGTGELDFLQAFFKRGFVNIPRMLFDYSVDLGLDYDAIGRIFAVLACVGGPTEGAFGPHVISRRDIPHDFDQVRALVNELEQKDIVRIEEDGERIAFSFVPLLSRLRATWSQYREGYEQEQLGTVDPALLAAEKLLGRPLSDREAADILDWTTNYGFEVDMVQAVIREGLRLGVTRFSYLNQIARQWYEEGVRTPADAELYVMRYRKAAAKHKPIIQYLGIKRQLTGAEQALLDKWTDEWGFSHEVIMRACEEATGSQNPLQYVNRVLESWRERGIKSVAEVDRLLSERTRRMPAAEADRTTRVRRSSKSNVFLQREKKDDSYYDHIFEKFGK